MSDPVHLFEAAKLGKAPFEFIGIERRLGSCAYCGHAITVRCMVRPRAERFSRSAPPV